MTSNRLWRHLLGCLSERYSLRHHPCEHRFNCIGDLLATAVRDRDVEIDAVIAGRGFLSSGNRGDERFWQQAQPTDRPYPYPLPMNDWITRQRAQLRLYRG